MSIFDKGQPVLSSIGQSIALCQRLARIENETSLYSCLDEILAEIAKNFDLEAAALVMRKPNQESFPSFLHDIHAFGLKSEEKKKLSFFLAQSIVPDLIQGSRCISRDDVRHDILGKLAMGQRTKLVSMLAAPMVVHGAVVGVFVGFRSEIGAFCVEDGPFFQKMASLLAEDIENTGAYLRLSKDATTGFYNRRVFFESLLQETLRSRRYQAPLSALMLEVDSITPKAAGTKKGLEQFLKRFSQRVASETRQCDIVARASDSTFLFLQPMTTAQSSFEFAQRICKQFQDHPIVMHENSVPINVSVGISSLCSTDDDGTGMLLRADLALSAARKKGKNQIVVYSDKNESI